MVDALSAYGPETLNDVDEMEAEIDALQEKLDTVTTVSSQNRCAIQVVEEVDGEIDPVTGDVAHASL